MSLSDDQITIAILRNRANELRTQAMAAAADPRDAMVAELVEQRRVRLRAEADGLDRAAEVLSATLSVPDTLP